MSVYREKLSDREWLHFTDDVISDVDDVISDVKPGERLQSTDFISDVTGAAVSDVTRASVLNVNHTSTSSLSPKTLLLKFISWYDTL